MFDTVARGNQFSLMLRRWLHAAHTLLFGALLAGACTSSSGNSTNPPTHSLVCQFASPAHSDDVALNAASLLRSQAISSEELVCLQNVIANRGLSVARRRASMYLLLARHFHQGMTLQEVLDMCCSETWLAPDGLQRLNIVCGRLPAGLDSHVGHLFACTFEGALEQSYCAYMALAGR